MTILIVSIEHPFQLIEAETDTVELRKEKRSLEALLREEIERRQVQIIFEESSPAKATIAKFLADQSCPPILWRNIIMTKEERQAAGIADALQNRPSRPDDAMQRSIERRIPADAVREDFFVAQILQTTNHDEAVLVLLGDMHVVPVAEKLRARGHNVDIRNNLVPIKRWE
jgi:hypothetical protein